MLVDKRIEELAYNLVNYSCRLKKGEKVLIEAFDIDYQLVACIVREAFKVGAYPFVETFNNRITRELLIGGDKDLFGYMAKYASLRMSEMDAYIGIRGGSNALEHSDVPSENMRDYVKYYSHPVHHDLRVKGTKWVVLRYPTLGMAQQSGMSTEAFEDLYFKVCNLDYSKMDKAMDNLKEILDHADKVRIVGPGKTDLSFSIKGIGSVKCSGHLNIPDGEIYTAPVRDSVNGVIQYNTPSIEDGFQFEKVCLTFKDGKIVEATANDTKKVNEIFDTDEGARYVGEFAFGVNPYITKPMGNILFDEKISGSIHFTPGCCYEDANNGNESSVHWDLVLMQTEEMGGGEIYIDDVLVRKNGRFVIDSLLCLNPENLT